MFVRINWNYMANMEQKASVKVSVNGEEAKKELDNLQKIAKGLRTQLAEASEAKDWKGAKKLDVDLKKVERQMARVKRETYDFNEVLTRLDKATPRELRQTLSAINREMNSGRVERGSTAWKDYQQKAAQVKKELQAINQEQKVAEPLITRLGNSVKNFFSSGIGRFAAFAGVGFSVSESISNFTSINDSMVDLKKYTDLTDKSLESLQKRFKGVVTSVDIEKMNAYAAEAGKLNEQGEEAIYNYSEAAKIIDQGLGADLGEGATEQIAKLSKMFGEDETMGLRGAMLATASAINDVAQSGTSNERYLVDFTARIGGVANNLNIAQADIIGFGAVLDENMQGVERSSTALQDVLMRMTSAPSKYAQIAGVSVREFTEMLKVDANEALLTFLQGIKSIGGLTDASPVLKDLQLTGSGMASTLTTLANNIDTVRERQHLANQAYSEGTSVIKEAELAESTASAQRQQKINQLRYISAELGEKLFPIQLAGLDLATRVLRIGKAMLDFYGENRKLINALVGAIVAYNAVLFIKNKWEVISAATGRILRASQLALAAAYNVLTGNVARSTAALRALNAVASINPYHIIITGILAATAAIVYFGKQTDLSTKAYARYTREIFKEKKELDGLIEKFNAAEKGSVAYNRIRDEIQSKYGDHLTAIGLEADAVHRNKKAYSELAIEIENAAKARIRAQLVEEQSDKAYASVANNYASVRSKVINKMGEAGGDTFNEMKAYMEGFDLESFDYEAVDAKFKEWGLVWTDYSKYFNKIYSEQYNLANKIKEIDAVLPKGKSTPTPDGGDSDGGDNPDNNPNFTPLVDSDKKLKEDLKRLDAWYAHQKATEASHYLQGLQSKIQYDDKMLEHERNYQERKRDLHAVGSKEYEELQAQILQKEVDAKVKADAESRTNLTDAFELQKAMLKQNYIDGEITRDSFQQQSINNEIAYLRKMAQLYPANSSERLKYEQQAEDLANKDKLAKREEFEQKRKQLQQRFSKASMADMYNLELTALESLHAEKLLSEEEFQKAKQALEKQYAQDVTTSWLESDAGQAMLNKTQFVLSSIQTLAGGFNDFISAEADGQIAAINQKYDAEIKAAGNNQYKLKQIEEKKQKEIAAVQAKAADRALALQMAVAIAQAVQGSINAYTSTAAIPIVGPGLAPVAAGIAMAAGMLNVAAVAKQHQAAKKGYYKGGFTSSGAWDEEQGVVHSDEFVANRFAVRNPHVRGILEVIDVAQRNNTIASLTTSDIVSSAGYSSSVNASGQTTTNENNEATVAVIYKLNNAVEKLNKRLEDPIQAYTTIDGDYGVRKGLADFEAQEKNKSR